MYHAVHAVYVHFAPAPSSLLINRVPATDGPWNPQDLKIVAAAVTDAEVAVKPSRIDNQGKWGIDHNLGLISAPQLTAHYRWHLLLRNPHGRSSSLPYPSVRL